MDISQTKKTLLDFLEGDADGYNSHKARKDTAKWNYSMMTGDSQDDFILRYRTKEDKEQKEQRMRVYNSRTPFVANKIFSQYDSIEQADNITENLKLKNENDNFEKTLNSINGVGLLPYLYKAMKRMTFFDPNGFILITKKDGDLAGYEVTSEQVLKFNYKSNELEYLIFEKSESFYIYSQSGWYKAKKLKDKERAKNKLITIKDSSFAGKYDLSFGEFGGNVCPAVQVGHIKNPQDDFKTFASPLQVAKKLFDDLMNDKNSYDVAKSVHAFLKKYAFVPKCENTTVVEGRTSKCVNGSMSYDGTECNACKGSGMDIHYSEQDVILFRMKSLEDTTNLANLVHYERIPMDIVASYKDDFKEVEKDIFNMVFQSELLDKTQVAQTATGNLLDKQAMNAKFVDYGNKLVSNYRHLVKAIASLQKVEIERHEVTITKDFKVETLGDLFAMRRESLNAQIPTYMLDMVDDKILSKITNNNKQQISRIKARERFRPFRLRNPDDKALILSTLEPTSREFILYVKYEEIIDAIERDRMNKEIKFHHMSEKEQLELINQELDKYVGEA